MTNNINFKTATPAEETGNKVVGSTEGANESVNEAQPQVTNQSSVEECRFSFFTAPINGDTTPKDVWTVRDAYTYIKGDEAAERTRMLRAGEGGVTKQKDFDYVIFSGLYQRGRTADHLVAHSGLLVLDYDHVGGEDKLRKLKGELLKNEYFMVRLMFTSPSGDGVKAVIDAQPLKGSTDREEHKAYYRGVLQCLKETMPEEFKAKADKSTCDVTRNCFLPHDGEAYINDDFSEMPKKPFDAGRWYVEHLAAEQAASGQDNERDAQDVRQQPIMLMQEGVYESVDRTPEQDSEVDNLVRRLVEQRMDITNYEPHWFRLSLAFASYYGHDSQGWQHFRAISQFYPGFTEGETREKYINALNREARNKNKAGMERITINYFIVSAKVALNPMPQPDPEHPYSFGSARSTSTEQEPQDDWIEEIFKELNNENNDEKNEKTDENV